MKKLVLTLLFLLGCTPALFAQNVTVSGNMKAITGVPSTTNTFVRFKLKNYTGNIPTVSGVAVVYPSCAQSNAICQDFLPNGAGAISGLIYGNDVISPSGTYYTLEFWYAGRLVYSADYLITGSFFNFNSAVPLTNTPTLGPNQLIVQAYPCVVPAPATTWTCNHGFNDLTVMVETFDLNGKQIFPDAIDTSNPNTTTITWIVAQAGKALILHAGNVAIATNQPNAVLQNPTGSQSIQNGLSISGPLVVGGGAVFGAPLIAPSIGPSAGQQHTLPAVTSDTFSLLNATQTLSNKTFQGSGSGTVALSLLPGVGLNAYSVKLNNSAAPRNLTISDPGSDDGFVFLSATQILLGKTLNSPVINTPTLNGSGGALALPAGPDTLVGRNTTDTLANKTLTAPVINGTPTGTGLQGTDPLLLTTDGSGATGDIWIRDANGGAKSGGAFPIIKGANQTTICTTTNSSYDQCGPMVITWSSPFANNSYFVACSAIGPFDVSNTPNNGRAYAQVISHTASVVNVEIITTGAAAITWASVECVGFHP